MAAAGASASAQPEGRCNNPGILSVRFNQDRSCFTCCLETGLRIYNIEPLECLLRYSPKVTETTVGLCEMFNRSSTMLLVPGGSKPLKPDNTILAFWNIPKKIAYTINALDSVKNVLLLRDRIMVATKHHVEVFNRIDCELLLRYETRENPRGLLVTSPLASSEKKILAFPGRKIGSVQVVDISNIEKGSSSSPLGIQAHKAELQCITINQQGTRLGTASVNGTLIRVWDTTERTLLIELRRGSDPATIQCINFSADSDYVCCSSDKGTIHIFAIKNTQLNKRMALSNMRILGTYIDSQWAFVSFSLSSEAVCHCTFTSNNNLVAVCMDGTIHKYSFGTERTSFGRDEFDVFLDVFNEDEFFASCMAEYDEKK